MVAMLLETLFNDLEGMERMEQNTTRANACRRNRNRNNAMYKHHQQGGPFGHRNHPYSAFFSGFPLGITMIESDNSSSNKELENYPTKSPTVDFIETEKAYNIAVELPGVSKESIDVKLENGFLTVSTGTTVETKIANEPKKKKSLEKIENPGVTSENDNNTVNTIQNENDDGVSVESLVDEEDAFSGEDVAAEKLALAHSSENKKRHSQNSNEMDICTESTDDNSNNYMYKYTERIMTKYQRSFKLDKRVTPQSITASFENGVLQLTIVKPEKRLPQRIAIM